MKVISGKLRGREILGFQIAGTRPTMDRVKESLFAMIQNHLVDSVCLDLFAGSGNLGIEAISNGATSVYFVDHNRKAIDVIKRNVEKFEVAEACHLLNLDYQKALLFFQEKQIKFDLVFLDPPYEENYIPFVLEHLVRDDLLKKDALVICEVLHRDFLDEVKGYTIWKERQYKDKYVVIYQKTA